MKQVVGRWPATVREFIPDLPKDEAFSEPDHLVSRVRVVETGADAEIEIRIRGQRAGRVSVDRKDEAEILRRLFGELATRLDRDAIQVTMDQLEDAIVSGDARARTRARRVLLAAFDTIARDLQDLTVKVAGVPATAQEKSA